MLSDSEIVTAIRASVGHVRSPGSDMPQFAYEVRDVRSSPGHVDIELAQRDGHAARLVLALPSSGEPQFWLYTAPEDAEDWVQQLLIWIDEEVFTGGLVSGRTRSTHDGASYVQVVPYGWRVTKAKEHARLSRAAGPFGWHG